MNRFKSLAFLFTMLLSFNASAFFGKENFNDFTVVCAFTDFKVNGEYPNLFVRIRDGNKMDYIHYSMNEKTSGYRMNLDVERKGANGIVQFTYRKGNDMLIFTVHRAKNGKIANSKGLGTSSFDSDGRIIGTNVSTLLGEKYNCGIYDFDFIRSEKDGHVTYSTSEVKDPTVINY